MQKSSSYYVSNKISFLLFLDNSDLISCTVITKDGQKIKGFMVIDALQLILVDPDNKRVGWGIAKFVGFLQVLNLKCFICSHIFLACRTFNSCALNI